MPMPFRAQVRAGRRVVAWPLAGVFVLSVLGCGDDTPTTGSAASPKDQIQGGIGQLADFRDSAAGNPGAQLLGTPEFESILAALQIPTPPVGVPQPPGASRPVRRLLDKLHPRRGDVLQDGFGTYDLDRSSTSPPFPGWVLTEPGNPPDGLVFRFDLEDGVTTGGETPVPIRGEFRFLDFQIDDRGTPDPDDDVITSLVIEIAATPAPDGPLPVQVRLDLNAGFDAMGEVQSFHLGDPNANDPDDPGAAFLGPVLLAVVVEGSASSIDMLVQIYDSSERFVVRLLLQATSDPMSGLLESASTTFGFGVTNRPASPPWRLTLAAQNFRVPPGSFDEIADISGEIVHNGILLASLMGDTSDVPIDRDGDEVPDDTCINVTVTFADIPESPQNLCLALPALEALFDTNMPKMLPSSLGWR